MKFAVAALALAGCAAAYDIVNSASLNCRKQPTTESDVVKVYQLGDDIEIVCQTTGQLVFGTKIWDATPDGCFVTDYYVRTGFGSIFKPVCQKSGDGNGVLPAPGSDDASGSESDEEFESGAHSESSEHHSSGHHSSVHHSSVHHSSRDSSDESESDMDSGIDDDSETSGASTLAAHQAAALAGAAIGLVAALF
ncbi:hypothetical protein IWQ56_002546 [Coemansia nantahalensis]|uniref:Uncharacterized protein n=1 Tax=Coemansia nantahalensis TaxID=2789366 RepID=A0ACC1K7G6_9FUNG|nr:hypothetical protein IWQ56_002546 [Coemansia nantahalensis]KAJ2774856.1 hypothetical protein IWQ57_000635 [Coemansia nantahalensis]